MFGEVEMLSFRFLVSTPSLAFISSSRKPFTVSAQVSHGEDDDSIFRPAIQRASLRLRESNTPGPSLCKDKSCIHTNCLWNMDGYRVKDPLFIDPYVACLLPPDIEVDVKPELHPYCLATKFIDDKLLSTMKNTDDLRQVVLLTDGMDTRPYRLNWPRSTMIFDVSPERVFKAAARKLGDVGAKVSKSCLFAHVPTDSSSIHQVLSSRGFNGARPSIWVLQGVPIMNLESFEEILLLVGSLAMKDCLFLGELPAWLVDTDVEGKSDARRWMDRIFSNNEFHVNIVKYNQIGENFTREIATEAYQCILFMANHLRYSDTQMDNWRREFQRIEEEGDEEGFEEL